MIEIPTIRKKVYKTFLAEFIESSEERRGELANDQYYSMVDWSEVNRLIGNDKLEAQIHALENEIQGSESHYPG
jgi:hypothetical protein